ncbi:MAG TPA: hypothetical protein VN193_04760 [Candidatus Angelobacter sp.]|nr:hypothetical protein [Candidatus Angelobacter sp.]
MSDTGEGFLSRLDAVEQRLAAHAAHDAATVVGQRTDADPGTGERWEWGQVWAHLAEFLPYWIEQTRIVIDGHTGEPVAFGRVKSDPVRVAAIARDRQAPIDSLWQRTHRDIASLRTFLSDLPEAAWPARGAHQTLGVMTLPHIVDEFMVGHLEQHAAQLDGLASRERA